MFVGRHEMKRGRLAITLAALAAMTVGPAGARAVDATIEPIGPDWSIAENQPCQVWNYGMGDKLEPFVWSGACVDGKASGEGRLTYQGGDGVFEGTMRAGKMHGYGTVAVANSFRYVGGLRDGVQHGRGTTTYANGDRFEAEYRDGLHHGLGIQYYADGTVIACEWRNDEIVSESCTSR